MNLKGDAGFARRNVLFAAGGGDPNTRISEDLVVIGTFTNRYYTRLKIKHAPDWGNFWPVFTVMSSILRKNTSIVSPSVFKRCAAFTIAFIQVAPLSQPFHGYLSPQLTEINNHQNAIVAFAYARQCLFGACFEHPLGTRIVLENKIKVSAHYYCDLIHALSSSEDTPSDFHLLSLVYESLTYEVNDASDPKIV